MIQPTGAKHVLSRVDGRQFADRARHCAKLCEQPISAALPTWSAPERRRPAERQQGYSLQQRRPIAASSRLMTSVIAPENCPRTRCRLAVMPRVECGFMLLHQVCTGCVTRCVRRRGLSLARHYYSFFDLRSCPPS